MKRNFPPKIIIWVDLRKAVLEFFYDIPIEERLGYKVSYNIHFYNSKLRTKVLYNYQTSPINLDKDGNVWLNLCVISLPCDRKPFRAIITKRGRPERWYFNRANKTFVKREAIPLTDNELWMIRLSAQGKSMKEISNEINKSVNTIKKYRKELFRKLDVSNMIEAISYATQNQLL